MHDESRVDLMEVELDAACVNLISRRNPQARDLRFVIATTKIVTNLERAGDEAERVAKRSKHIGEDVAAHAINHSELKLAADMALQLLRGAMDAYARLDSSASSALIMKDQRIDDEFRAFVRKLMTYMIEDPRTISVGLDFLTVAKAIERIGDHATNIAELVVYIDQGTDIRHTPRQGLLAPGGAGMPLPPAPGRTA